MDSFIPIAAAACAGYAAAVFTWPRLRQFFVGVENEIEDLRRKVRALESRLRG